MFRIEGRTPAYLVREEIQRGNDEKQSGEESMGF